MRDITILANPTSQEVITCPAKARNGEAAEAVSSAGREANHQTLERRNAK